MLHAEYRGGNPLTGWQSYAVRDLDGTQFGGKWRGSLIIERPHYFAKTAELILAENINTPSQYRQMKALLKSMGFRGDKAARAKRNGRWKYYKV